MTARKVLAGFAVLALAVGVLASVANAAPSCGHKVCSDEAAASGLTGAARGACLKSLISDCQAGACSCTGGSAPCSCVCGDGLCGPSETCATCAQDCAPPFVTKWGSSGSGDGQFEVPFGVATDGSGNVYVADDVNDRMQKFDGSGTFLTKWGTSGSGDGQFNNPWGVATDGSGNVYVADAFNNRIQKFSCQ